jgi:hypothetical protein
LDFLTGRGPVKKSGLDIHLKPVLDRDALLISDGNPACRAFCSRLLVFLMKWLISLKGKELTELIIFKMKMPVTVDLNNGCYGSMVSPQNIYPIILDGDGQ